MVATGTPVPRVTRADSKDGNAAGQTGASVGEGAAAYGAREAEESDILVSYLDVRTRSSVDDPGVGMLGQRLFPQ
jgi:hypothetical protein